MNCLEVHNWGVHLSVVVAWALCTPFGHKSSLIFGELACFVPLLCKYPLIYDRDGVLGLLDKSPSAHLLELG